jgi:hypothetical protein|tara:strand:+ start:466 stop:585 length:120 start_codon:yes stop_codon:yes gene_type:complete
MMTAPVVSHHKRWIPVRLVLELAQPDGFSRGKGGAASKN